MGCAVTVASSPGMVVILAGSRAARLRLSPGMSFDRGGATALMWSRLSLSWRSMADTDSDLRDKSVSHVTASGRARCRLHVLQTATMVYHMLSRALRADEVPSPVAGLMEMLDGLPKSEGDCHSYVTAHSLVVPG